MEKCRTLFQYFFRKTRGIPVEPYKHQVETWRTLYELSQESSDTALLLNAPTGSGKTEAVLFPYLCQAFYDEWIFAPGFIYVLPNKTLINYQYHRIKEIIDLIFKEKPSEAPNVGVDIGGLSPEKTYLFGDIVITTLDAFVYGLIGRRTYSWVYKGTRFGKSLFPIGNIASSMVIFDEVQLYQDENLHVLGILGELVKNLSSSGIPTVIMTATIPKLLEDLLVPKNAKKIKAKDHRGSKGELKEVEFHNETIIEYMNRKEFSKMLKEFDRIIVIVNTVSGAIEAFLKIREILKKQAEILLLHSRLRSGYRKTIEKKLKNLAGRKHILVSTQVSESGLDIDTELLLTEWSPIDSLIQRVGRVARREKTEGTIHIFEPQTSLPYNETLLNFTKKTLKEYYHTYGVKALQETSLVQEMLDEVYTPETMGNILPRYNLEIELINMLSPLVNLFYSNRQFHLRLEPFYYVLILEESKINELIQEGSLRLSHEELEEKILRLTKRTLDQLQRKCLGNEIFLKVVKIKIIGEHVIIKTQKSKEIEKRNRNNTVSLIILPDSLYKRINEVELGLIC